jgi:hypothetical protein
VDDHGQTRRIKQKQLSQVRLAKAALEASMKLKTTMEQRQARDGERLHGLRGCMD